MFHRLFCFPLSGIKLLYAFSGSIVYNDIVGVFYKEIEVMSCRMMMTCLAALLLGLAGCTSTQFSHPGTPGTQTSSLSAADDPDGDSDAKGLNYFPATRPATGKRVFIFDPTYNAWAIYDESGNRVNIGRASGGQLYCPDIHRRCTTVMGTFKVISKGGADCISHKFPIETHGGAKTPYCMLFHPKGYAIHGSNDVPDRNASHGCIRVTPLAAKWLSENFIQVGTTVIVLPYSDAHERSHDDVRG